jgi:hypothetical protein
MNNMKSIFQIFSLVSFLKFKSRIKFGFPKTIENPTIHYKPMTGYFYNDIFYDCYKKN